MFFILLLAIFAFAIFPLTDTDIWWHLACAREWVTTWTPVRTPVVNVHEFFQNAVSLVYGLGGAPLLVTFKSLLWCGVFALFLRPLWRKDCELSSCETCGRTAWNGIFFLRITLSVGILFLFRYQLEMRPVVFSLIFLGIFWNVLPEQMAELIVKYPLKRSSRKIWGKILILLFLQWIWCKCQGLYVIGPIFATVIALINLYKVNAQNNRKIPFSKYLPAGLFLVALWLMPFLHKEGLALFLYPFGLLNRLLGATPSASIFASQIAENRSPITLLQMGENGVESFVMVVLAMVSLGHVFLRFFVLRRSIFNENTPRLLLDLSLFASALLTLVAQRNFVLFLPFFIAFVMTTRLPAVLENKVFSTMTQKGLALFSVMILFFLLGLWGKSLQAYDRSFVSYQRVPVSAAQWMKEHPHQGRLFNDDRAGGYLAFTNPQDSIYIDGRFILKTAEFFERYLQYAVEPELFLKDADSLGIDRTIFPIRYYARWGQVIETLAGGNLWKLSYMDEFFCVFDKPKFSKK